MAYYHDESGEYLAHYTECCLNNGDKSCYGVITGEEDYERLKTKIDAALENMNSYNRRIIHNVLTNYKNIVTVSEGEEPNRHVVIKYVESKEDNKSE